MVGASLLGLLVVVAPPATSEVTAAEKKAFLKLLAKLDTKGEFFTDESVKKVLPHTRVLLALTAKDIKKYDLYPFMALTSQLGEHKAARARAAKQFGAIAHPLLQLAWAVKLFDAAESTPEVLKYLKKVVDSEKASKVLDEMLGPESEHFKKRVRAANVKRK